MALNKYVKKTLKILAWTIGSVLGLLLLLVLLLQVPAVQNFAKDKAVRYLEGKIHTPVRIGRIEIGLPKKVILEDVYLQDQRGDTLLSGEKIAVDISLFKLLDDQVEINSVALKGIVANVKRNKDSVFNFDYIIDAFASKEPKDDTGGMQFSINKVRLDNIRLRFDDAITKNDLKVSLVHFDTKITEFDLDKMHFEIPEIALDGVNLQLKQGELLREIATNTLETADSLVKKRPDLDIRLGEIALTSIKVGYDNAGTKLNSGLALQKLAVDFKETNLPQQRISIRNLELSGVNGALTMGKSDKESVSDTISATAKSNWKLQLDKASLNKIAFRFNDENAPKAPKGIDYKHLALQDLNFEGENFNYASGAVSGKIESFSVKEKSGLNVQALRTDFAYGEKGASLKNLYVKTPKTLVRDKITVTYPALETLKTNPGALQVDANFEDSRIAFADILKFVPDLSKTNPFKDNPDAVMNINGSIKGRLNNIEIPNMEISGIGSTTLAASGRIMGLPEMKKAWFNMTIRDFRTGAKDIYTFVPAGTIPASLQLPQQLALKGTFRGSMDNFSTNMALNSSFGAARVKADFDRRFKNREKYDAVAELDNFDLGKLIKNDSLGKISLEAKIKGSGLDPKTATATLDGTLIKAAFNGYTYRNLNVKGAIRNGQFKANAGMNDPNLNFALASEGRFSGKYPAVKMLLDIDIADLQKLSLSSEPLKIRGKMDADIATADPDFLNGKISAYHLVVANEKEQFQLDSINIIATATAEKNTLQVKSQLLKANIDGKYQLTKVGSALSNSIAKYYDTNPTAKKTTVPPQQFAFNVTVSNDPVIMKLVPKITRLEPITITGRYNSVNDTIAIDAAIPRIIYGANTIAGAVIKVETIDNALVYNVVIDEIQNEQFRLPYTSIAGNLKDNILTYRLQLRDGKDKEQYVVAGTLEAKNGNTEVHLLPEDLLLNYERWLIADNNVIRFGNKGIYADDFELSNSGSAIRLQSQSETVNAPLAVDFTDFNIETITRMVQKESLAMGGKINGNVLLKNLNTKPVFTSDLTIENFTFKKDTIGNINIKVNNQVADTYAAQVSITGNGNQVNLDGTYRSASESFDLNLDLGRLNLASIQPFTADNLTKSSGYVSGKFKINGTVQKPKILGSLQFHDGAFTVTKLNSAFSLMNDKIVFTNEGLVFERFTLADSDNNVLAVRGKIDTPDYRDYAFNLRIDADNFRAINSSAKDNDLYYGQLFLDTHLRVKGDLNKPVIDGNIKIKEDTKMTIVLPQSDPSIADREGIVEFIDQDNPQLNEKLIIAKDSLSKTAFRGMNVSVNIEIDKEAELTMIIDKGNGDYLKLKGEAQLNGGIDESGKTTLTGRYELQEGAYEMTFNFLKRKFEIQKGSYILWTGEPTSANINITAVYKTKTAPIDLLEDQLESYSPAIRNTYKERIPFETLLIMKGELLKPEITFDIRLPEGNYNVASEIITATRSKLEQLRQEPGELNKQVFALLLLNRFIGENPFASESGTGAESLARQSVSKILSQQLNNLAGDLIKGVEVDFDLESSDDYTTGVRENRTDLNVGVSKRLLNDRLKVTVGSSFGLEGPQQENRETNNIAGDVSLDYQLSKDGRYVLRAYRKNEYQVALQGQVIETGVAFIITMDYNKFRELFHRTEEEKELNRQLKKKKREEKLREKQEEEAKEAEVKKI